MEAISTLKEACTSLMLFVLFFSISNPLISQEFSFPLDDKQIAPLLQRAPMDNLEKTARPVIQLPTPSGEMVNWEVVESPVVGPKVAERLQVRTYAVEAQDGSGRIGRLTFSPLGLYGVFRDGEVIYFVDKLKNEAGRYRSFMGAESIGEIQCGVEYAEEMDQPALDKNSGPDKSLSDLEKTKFGNNLRIFDLVVAATEEYTAFFNGQAAAETNTVNVVNAINLIFQPEMAVRFNLVGNTALVQDNYNPASSADLAGTIIGDVFPNAATYDIGHVFHRSTDAGSGEAGLGVVCGGQKGEGWSGSNNPNATNFGWILLATHEFGHQFGADHSFDGTANNCNQRAAGAAYEPLSGSTIMSYFNICGPQNINPPRVSLFHVNSLDQMNTYLTPNNTGSTCFTAQATGNTPPVANANPSNSNNLTIPTSTPFRLTGSGTDADGHPLTYSWEQHDLANTAPPTTDVVPRAGDPTAPLFRSYFPTASPTRNFPARQYLLTNNYLNIDEALPTVGRTMDFRLTVRDNQGNGGGVDWAALNVTVDGNSGPFQITSPNGGENLTAGNNLTVNWNTSNTEGYCANVDIRLSLDGGYTFPVVLEAGTANDGNQVVTIPANVTNTTMARIEVACANNSPVAFFDISDGNFSVMSNCLADGGFICPAGPMTLPQNDPQLNLNLNNFPGIPLSSYDFTIGQNPTINSLVASDGSGNAGCQVVDFFGTPYRDFLLSVEKTGVYGFTLGGLNYMTLFNEATFSEANPCASFLGATFGPGANVSSSISTINANLQECSTYRLRVYKLDNVENFTLRAFGTTGGQLYLLGTPPGNGYSYTYAAVNSGNQLIAAIDAGANFTTLQGGTYNIYGLSYADAVQVNNLVGQTVNQVNGVQCVSFSKNSKMLTVTGGGGGCNLNNTGLANVQCNDNGTNANAADDYITFSLNPTGNNLGNAYNVTVSAGAVTLLNGNAATNIPYGAATNFRLQNGSAGAGNVTVTVTDATTANCTVNSVVNDPGTCSPQAGQCALNNTGLANVQCNDSGTNANAADDYITFSLNPTGNNLGNAYNVTVSAGTVTLLNGNAATNIPYGAATNFRLQNGSAGAGNVTVTVTDAATANCTTNSVITDPGACSGGGGNCVATTYTSTDVTNKIISSAQPVTSVIQVPAGGTIQDVNVLNLQGTHTWINDLTIRLRSPSNTEIVLIQQICNDEDDFNFNLDDDVANPSTACPPVGGVTYQPAQALSAFDGQNPGGTWTLTIEDGFADDNGTLTGWQLQICVDGGGGNCTLNNTGLANVQCNDNGTNANAADDYITFSLNPTGNNLGNAYNVAVSAGAVTLLNGNAATNIPYGAATAFRLQDGSAGTGNVTVTVTDAATANCTTNSVITDPGACSNGGGNCPDNLPVNGTIASGTYTARNITSSGTVNNGSTVTFRAETSITLQPGFQATAGSTFTAQIAPCPAALDETAEEVALTAPQTDVAKKHEIERTGTFGLAVRPNPFNGWTVIDYQLDAPGTVNLAVYNLMGRQMELLVSEELQTEGAHQITYQPANLGAGIYFLVLRVGDQQLTRKIIRID